MKPRVMLIDDHQSFLDAVRLLLEQALPDVQIVGAVADPAKAVEVAVENRPDVVLLDMRFPEEDGIKVMRRLLELDDPPKVLVLSASSDVEDVRGALFAGAVGYLTKDGGGESIVTGIRSALAGMVVLSAPALMALRIQPSAIKLTVSARQLSMLERVGQGFSDEELASEFHLSRTSVQRELQRCVRELGARNRTHAAVLAAQAGWI